MIYIVIYHVFLILWAWSYFTTIFSRMKKPGEEVWKNACVFLPSWPLNRCYLKKTHSLTKFYLSETDVYQMNISTSPLAPPANGSNSSQADDCTQEPSGTWRSAPSIYRCSHGPTWDVCDTAKSASVLNPTERIIAVCARRVSSRW